MTHRVEVTREGAIAIIRLNRPKQLNALNTERAAALIGTVQARDTDPSIG